MSHQNRKNRKVNKKPTKHHLIPKERVKLHNIPENEVDRDYNRVLMLWRDRHDAFHILFHNMTLGEIILVLQRIERIKYKDHPL